MNPTPVQPRLEGMRLVIRVPGYRYRADQVLRNAIGGVLWPLAAVELADEANRVRLDPLPEVDVADWLPIYQQDEVMRGAMRGMARYQDGFGFMRVFDPTELDLACGADDLDHS